MSGIMHKIGETLHMGGQKKEEEKHKGEGQHGEFKGDHHYGGEHKGEGQHGEYKGEHKGAEQHRGGEQKEGIMDKIKDKIHGDGGEHGADGEKKKKKKEKKKHEDGHESSSSSDSD